MHRVRRVDGDGADLEAGAGERQPPPPAARAQRPVQQGEVHHVARDARPRPPDGLPRAGDARADDDLAHADGSHPLRARRIVLDADAADQGLWAEHLRHPPRDAKQPQATCERAIGRGDAPSDARRRHARERYTRTPAN